MSAQISIHISGIAEIRKQLSPEVFRTTVLDALRSGLAPVAAAASALAPRKTGRLAQGIRAAVSTRGGAVSGSIVTQVRYGHLVEYGHRQVTGGRLARRRSPIFGRSAGPGRQVGTVPPHPFVRPAFATQQPAIAEAIERRLAAAIGGP